jgi:hypothetical protein
MVLARALRTACRKCAAVATVRAGVGATGSQHAEGAVAAADGDDVPEPSTTDARRPASVGRAAVGLPRLVGRTAAARSRRLPARSKLQHCTARVRRRAVARDTADADWSNPEVAGGPGTAAEPRDGALRGLPGLEVCSRVWRARRRSASSWITSTAGTRRGRAGGGLHQAQAATARRMGRSR